MVGVNWTQLEALADKLGPDVPPGMWLVRMSRHGGWLSLASGMNGEAAELVRATVDEHRPANDGPWETISRELKSRLDPNDILNPR